MKKSEMQTLRQYVGDLDAIFGIKDYTYNDGPARGMRALDVKNGKGLEMTLAADRGLDIPCLRYKGVNVSFAAKVGLRAPSLYTEDAGRGFLKQFNAGMLTTCGITYAGAACEDGGRKLGLHGNYDNTPAAKVAYETVFDGDEAVLRLRGEVREACVFEENMLLTREVRIHTEKNVYQVIDRVENQGFEPTPMMLIYHINFGHPLLDEGARIYVNSGHVEPRDDFAREGLAIHDRMEAPEIGRAEQCYFHTGFPAQGFAMLHNEKLGMAAALRFDAKALPLLCEWKCMRAGEYVLGLEPTTSGVLSRVEARANGLLVTLEPGQVYESGFEMELTDDAALIEEYKKMAN